MRIKLDIQLNRKLRDKINEIDNFAIDKTAEFQFPLDKRVAKQESNAFNCICSALDRIDDVVSHCNTLNLTQTSEVTFAFCDLLNYSQTLIDCITKIGDVYGVKYDSLNDVSSFHQPGIDGKGNDEKYFKYLRSLCSVHPLDTSAHKDYQGNQPEWCPYIDFAKSIAARLLSLADEEISKADYIAKVYRNDMEFSKFIPIQVNQIFHYIYKRYKFINNIIIAIDKYNSNKIEILKSRHILLPSECASYDGYLKNLEREIHIRCGQWEYKARTWRAIFMTHYDDEQKESALSAYKKALKIGIEKIHNILQAMDFQDSDYLSDVICDRNIESLREYYYEMEKMVYLFPSYALEDIENEDFSFINEPIKINCLRIENFLNAIDQAIKEGMEHNELKDCARYLDAHYGVNKSEWACIQLKIMSPVLGKHISFDYLSNNWKLYLQVEIAKWLLSINIEFC